jgi:hypothetical protein
MVKGRPMLPLAQRVASVVSYRPAVRMLSV